MNRLAILAVDDMLKHLAKAMKHMQLANMSCQMLSSQALPEPVRRAISEGERTPWNEGGIVVQVQCHEAITDFMRKLVLANSIRDRIEEAGLELRGGTNGSSQDKSKAVPTQDARRNCGSSSECKSGD